MEPEKQRQKQPSAPVFPNDKTKAIARELRDFCRGQRELALRLESLPIRIIKDDAAEFSQSPSPSLRLLQALIVGVILLTLLAQAHGLQWQNASPVDSLFFAVETVTTVGYGSDLVYHETGQPPDRGMSDGQKMTAVIAMLFGPLFWAGIIMSTRRRSVSAFAFIVRLKTDFPVFTYSAVAILMFFGFSLSSVNVLRELFGVEMGWMPSTIEATGYCALIMVPISVLHAAGANVEFRKRQKQLVDINAPIATVWKAWTTNEEAQEWLAPKTNITFEEDGSYEFFWNDNPEEDSTLGCKLLKIKSERCLLFEWKGKTEILHNFLPPKGKRTTIKVTFTSKGENARVIVDQQERRGHPDWMEYDLWMSQAWRAALQSLKAHCEGTLTKPFWEG